MLRLRYGTYLFYIKYPAVIICMNYHSISMLKFQTGVLVNYIYWYCAWFSAWFLHVIVKTYIFKLHWDTKILHFILLYTFVYNLCTWCMHVFTVHTPFMLSVLLLGWTLQSGWVGPPNYHHAICIIKALNFSIAQYVFAMHVGLTLLVLYVYKLILILGQL